MYCVRRLTYTVSEKRQGKVKESGQASHLKFVHRVKKVSKHEEEQTE